MRVQIDRFEELLPAGASAGDVFEVRFDRDRAETERLARENRRLLDELLGRDDG